MSYLLKIFKIVAIPKELNPPACPLSISMKAMEILAASKGQGKVFKVIPRERYQM
jgi:hypothetical protein